MNFINSGGSDEPSKPDNKIFEAIARASELPNRLTKTKRNNKKLISKRTT